MIKTDSDFLMKERNQRNDKYCCLLELIRH